MNLFKRSLSILYKILTSLKFVLLEHVPILFLLLLYLGYAFYIEYRLDNYQIIELRSHLAWLMIIILLVNLAMFSLIHYFLKIRKGGIQGNYARWYDSIAPYLCFNRISGFILIIYLIYIEFTLFDNLKYNITNLVPYCYDTILMKFDYILHFNNHPWMLLSPILTNTVILRVIDIIYISWFYLIDIFIFWLGFSGRRKLRMQFFMTFLLILFVVGNLLATVFSSAGPCYYEKIARITENNPYKPLMDKLHSTDDHKPSIDKPYDKSSNNSLIALKLQDNLWNNHINNVRQFGHYISAMPSVHVAFAALLALTISAVNIYLGIIFWVYWLVIQFGSVILGWHYAVDGYFSTILTIVLWQLSSFIHNWYWDKLPKHFQSQIIKPNLSVL